MEARAVLQGHVVGQQFSLLTGAVLIAKPRLQLPVFPREVRAALVAQQVGYHIDHARRIQDVDGRLDVLRRDLDGRVLAAGRRSVSVAQDTISSGDGGIKPLSPTRSAFSSSAVFRIRSQGTMTPRSTTS